MSRRVAWIDCAAGAAGDMLLAALVDAGVDEGVVRRAVSSLGLEIALDFAAVDSGGLRARRATVSSNETEPPRRTWRDIRSLLDQAGLDGPVHDLAGAVFARLAAAEAAVHGSDPEDVHFHEVGAHDAVADVVGCAAAFVALDAHVTVSAVALGGGSVRGAHGVLPVPAPAVLELLRAAGLPAYGGPEDVELCTPTGAAVLASVASASGRLPPMTVEAVGLGAGRRVLPGRPNVVRVVVGAPAAAEPLTAPVEEAVLLAANVDDFDPRLWPGVLTALMAAGAADAWLTPILMKKGRPAHALQVLCSPVDAPGLRRLLLTETSTLGVREQAVAKTALDRDVHTVAVAGHTIRIKRALLDGQVVNAQPEYEDVVAAAQALDRPAKAVLAAATAAAGAAGLLPL